MNFRWDIRGKYRTRIAEACPHFPAVAEDNSKSTWLLSLSILSSVYQPVSAICALRAYLADKIFSFGTPSLAQQSRYFSPSCCVVRKATEIYASTTGFVGFLLRFQKGSSFFLILLSEKSLSMVIVSLENFDNCTDWFARQVRARERHDSKSCNRI